MIKETLEKIGLTPGEAEVYEALVSLGQCTTGSITKKANIASSKVYEVLQRLTNKGLVSHIIKNNVKYFDATPPERLLDFLEDKKDELSNAQENIKKIIPAIRQQRESAKERNQVIVYTGIQGPKIVLKDTIESGKKGARLCGYGTDEDPYKDYLPKDIEQHFKDQVKHNIYWYLLFTKGNWRSPSPRAHIRYLPKGFSMPVRTMIYGDKVAIVDFNKPITTIIIEKKEIVQNYYKQFDFLWKIAKP